MNLTGNVTTLRSLIQAHRPVEPPDSVRLPILALGDRPRYAPSLEPLPGALREAQSLRRRFPDRHTAKLDADATWEQAHNLLVSHSCVHFACHAGQNLTDPSQGVLCLYDKPLKVTDLARLNLEQRSWPYCPAAKRPSAAPICRTRRSISRGQGSGGRAAETVGAGTDIHHRAGRQDRRH